MDYLKRVLSTPRFKYGLLSLGAGVWTVGLIDQLSSSAGAVKYVMMSLLMVAVAML